MKSQIPNFLTLTNLMSGCMGIVSMFVDRWDLVPMFWGISIIADGMDGMMARALKVSNPLGKELDSLADMVTFGVLPGVILYHLMAKMTGGGVMPEKDFVLLALPGFLITLFSAIRLAKFNIDERQTEGFIGLATPACTGYVVGLLALHTSNSYGLGEVVLNPYLLYGSAVLFAYLLISEIPMFSFKFKALKWKGNEYQIIYLALAVVLIALLGTSSFSLGVLIYLVMVVVHNLTVRKSLFYKS